MTANTANTKAQTSAHKKKLKALFAVSAKLLGNEPLPFEITHAQLDKKGGQGYRTVAGLVLLKLKNKIEDQPEADLNKIFAVSIAEVARLLPETRGGNVREIVFHQILAIKSLQACGVELTSYDKGCVISAYANRLKFERDSWWSNKTRKTVKVLVLEELGKLLKDGKNSQDILNVAIQKTFLSLLTITSTSRVIPKGHPIIPESNRNERDIKRILLAGIISHRTKDLLSEYGFLSAPTLS